ncbi:MAG: OmpA family protein, partial [Gammaproteobacteria bacterium]|nr:OmpA family protein [Gammaproteobacteria bacterium]
REQLKRLEALFTPADAVVLRRGDELTLRLHGLAFASSSARLEAGATALLERVGAALALYPNARVAVEGHTDSSGDSVANQRLSQQRAETVRDHLAAQAGNAASGMTAIGYGDTRPIASNEDAAGRRENRRIDLVITPPPGTLP